MVKFNMALIYTTDNFVIAAPDQPHIDRDDGGHIIIYPKIKVGDRQQLAKELAIELMMLTIITGQAMRSVMNKHGVDIGRINYQDNGNWSVFDPEGPYLHIHLYGRAKSAKIQKYGQACFFPHIEENPEYYKKLKPLNIQDIKEIRVEINKLVQQGTGSL
jgi:diadenosine tetraphosphate (Ap4A) HIT family hydrolase